MKREMERLDRERRKEEERVLRERQREEERFQREQRRESERQEKFLQKQSRRVSWRRQLFFFWLIFWLALFVIGYLEKCYFLVSSGGENEIEGRTKKREKSS